MRTTSSSFLTLYILIFTAALLEPFAAKASTASSVLPAPVAERLSISGLPAQSVSIYLREVSAQRPLLQFNEQVPRNPASVMKLLTTFGALDMLGPDYTWRTDAYVRGTLKNGRLEGDLILKGYGDPYITPEALWKFLRGLRERGLEEIIGDVILDGSFLEKPTQHRGDFDGRPHRAYNALPHSLSVNFQAALLHLYPDQEAQQVRVFSDPPLANLTIKNGLTLVNGSCRGNYFWPDLTVSQNGSNATVNLRGKYSTKCPELTFARLLMDPVSHAGGAFTAIWQESGGRFAGSVRGGRLPTDAVLFHSMQSRTLAEVIRGINKYSNNLMSRLLLLTLGAERYGAPGTLDKGRQALAAWLRTQGLEFRKLVVDNGSGLSRESRITAQNVGHLLLAAYNSPYMPEFIASLALAGLDGTMRRRVRNTPVTGRAHIKTGSLNGVSSMAGYIQDRERRRWVVVLIINDHKVTRLDGIKLQDALLNWVFGGVNNLVTAAARKVDSSRGCTPSEQGQPLAAGEVKRGSYRAAPSG